MSEQRLPIVRRLGLVTLLGLVALGCSSTSESEAAREEALARQLAAAAEEAGVAPRVTADVAASLYGTDASAVCDAFDGGTSSAADLILRGNLALGRRKTITDDAVIFAGLVIDTYCPDVRPAFEDVVADLDPVETSG